MRALCGCRDVQEGDGQPHCCIQWHVYDSYCDKDLAEKMTGMWRCRSVQRSQRGTTIVEMNNGERTFMSPPPLRWNSLAICSILRKDTVVSRSLKVLEIKRAARKRCDNAFTRYESWWSFLLPK